MNGETFEEYLRNARNEFVRMIELQKWDTNLRCAAEDFLIAFDQAREKALMYEDLCK